MSVITCPQCGQPFYQDEHWKRICYDCWCVNNGKTRRRSRSNFNYGGNYSAGQDRRYNASHNASQEAPKPISADLLKRLIHLCHPDKHGNSPMSVEVTQQLLQMKKEM